MIANDLFFPNRDRHTYCVYRANPAADIAVNTKVRFNDGRPFFALIRYSVERAVLYAESASYTPLVIDAMHEYPPCLPTGCLCSRLSLRSGPQSRTRALGRMPWPKSRYRDSYKVTLSDLSGRAEARRNPRQVCHPSPNEPLRDIDEKHPKDVFRGFGIIRINICNSFCDLLPHLMLPLRKPLNRHNGHKQILLWSGAISCATQWLIASLFQVGYYRSPHS